MGSSSASTMILGAGVTGLAASWASGLPVYEAEQTPGGICSSYYMRPGERARLHLPPEDGEAYRFELGGGHWIFGADPLVLKFMRSLAPLRTYNRSSAVFFPDSASFVPYPLQNNLKYLGTEIIEKALAEMAAAPPRSGPPETLAAWLEHAFGPTLCDLFFAPFHELYTAGLSNCIAPQDAYKSPVNLSLAIQGAFNHVRPVGYNTCFVYPEEGLSTLTQRIASGCDVRYGKKVERINPGQRDIYFADGTSVKFKSLLTTLPLNRMLSLTGLSVPAKPDPSPSVLVINIGARRGRACPDEHWIYVPKSKSGFHRVGFYSNVDSSFLPASRREEKEHVSIYVEKAYPEGQKPSSSQVTELCLQVAQELREWGWILEVDVVDPTWIEVAYTWSWPGSKWRDLAIQTLENEGIYPVGRYARWVFQGIADSIRDGLLAGAALREVACRDASIFV